MKLKLSRSTLVFLFILLIFMAVLAGLKIHRHFQEQRYINENFLTYKGFEFKKMADMWWTTWVRGNDEFTIPFRFNPKQTVNITINGSAQGFSFNPVYITFDPNGSQLQYVALAASELTISLAKVFSVKPISACTAEKAGVCPPKPIINCTNTNESVIYIKTAQKTAIIAEGNCITFQGTGAELVRAVDRFLFRMYKIQ